MKELITQLRDTAKLFLTDEQAVRINKLINEEKWNQLRMYLDELSDKYDLANLVNDADQQRLDEWLAVDRMNDIATELAIQMKEANEQTQPKRRKRIIRQE